MLIDSAAQLSEEIRRKRKSLKLTLEQAALVSGVSMSFLRSLERGKETCQLAPALRVIKALGLSLTLEGAAPASIKVKPRKTRTKATPS